MNKTELVQGIRVAYREKRSSDSPLHHVEVIDGEVRDRQVKVLFVDGEREGLRSWVRASQLLSPWSDLEPLLRDERLEEALRADWKQRADPVLETAMSAVVVATGESGGLCKGWDETPAVFSRLWKRAGMKHPPTDHTLAYRDRHGRLHLPWDIAMEFCVAFCRAEPEMVLTLIDGYEQEARAKGFMPGHAYYHQALREDVAAHAVVRDWCGNEEERTRLLKEIQRLQTLVASAALELDRAGAVRAANRLRRAAVGL
jgi:hypothetical protein